MSRPQPQWVCVRCLALLGALAWVGQGRAAELPTPVLEQVYPAGAAAGQSIEIAVAGTHLDGLRTLHSNVPGFLCEPSGPNQFRVTVPAATTPGLYDVWALCANGLTAPRVFMISQRVERVEIEPNDAVEVAVPVPLDVVLHGRINPPGDRDLFRFEARRGMRVVVECSAERIDSRLRAVLEVLDDQGRRLAVNRGYFGPDPLIDFRVPADGTYVVSVQDLISSGSAQHYYRLEIDTGPRVTFAFPSVVPQGQAARIALFGWNLRGRAASDGVTGDPALDPKERSVAAGVAGPLDHVEVDLPATASQAVWPLPGWQLPTQAGLDAFPYLFPGSQSAVMIGTTSVPVVVERGNNGTPSEAQDVSYPCEINGQLTATGDCDWFAIQALRGEVLYLEVIAQRMQSPIDAQLSVVAESGKELSRFSDHVATWGVGIPTSHLDPAGRWVVPADGRYLIAVRNLMGGAEFDPRRIYRLSVRREEPDFDLLMVPQRTRSAALNLRRNGREVVELLAHRRRGLDGSIRVTALNLPTGIECPDVWLGPGVDRALAVVSASNSFGVSGGAVSGGAVSGGAGSGGAVSGELQLEGVVDEVVRRSARAATVVRAGSYTGWGRIVSSLPLTGVGEAPLRITADGHETIEHHLYGSLQIRHAPGGVLDVAVQLERREAEHHAPVQLIGVGVPELIENQTATIPAGESKGYVSFYLPPTLPPGHYSLVIQAETTVPGPDQKPETALVFSNPVEFEVQPADFRLEVDPQAPTRARRGEVIQVRYRAQRQNGFIGKIHTELAAPGRVTDVIGLRGRGETFVGQSDSGSLQIIVNDDAPLGRQPFLRLFSVGVREDQPVAFGSRFLELEITE